MISEIDLKDMKPSDRVEAVNHVGWEVQYLPIGGAWQGTWNIFVDKKMAIEYLVALQKLFPQTEYRVYEVLSNKKTAALLKPKGS